MNAVISTWRYGSIRRIGSANCAAYAIAYCSAFEAGAGISVVGHQLDVFLFEPEAGRYLGRLCTFSTCPKGKRDCLVPGCGEIPFNKRVADFEPYPDLLAPVAHAMLYTRDAGRLRSALDLPGVPE